MRPGFGVIVLISQIRVKFEELFNPLYSNIKKAKFFVKIYQFMEVGFVDHELVQGWLGSQRHLVALRIILRVVTQVLPCYPVLIPEIIHPTNQTLPTKGQLSSFV
jgi:hypothetical protein